MVRGAAGRGREHSKGQSHLRRLAAVVGPEHRVHLARPRRQAHTGERVRARLGEAVRDAPDVEDQLAVHRRSSRANTGTPTSPVTIPTGSSRGAPPTPATVPANASTPPPPAKHAGRRLRVRS